MAAALGSERRTRGELAKRWSSRLVPDGESNSTFDQLMANKRAGPLSLASNFDAQYRLLYTGVLCMNQLTSLVYFRQVRAWPSQVGTKDLS